MKATLSVDRLIVNGFVYTVDTLHKLPAHLKPEVISMQKDDKYTFYFGQDCPLSNFYLSPFDIDGIHFNCSEQYLQHTKAKMFNDETTAAKILSTSDPLQQKSLGRSVVGFNWNTWASLAPELVKRGLIQKFTQNVHPKDVLMQTQDTELVECSATDKFWGIGLSLNNKNKHLKDTWAGQNMMGKLLRQVRAVINA